MADQRITLSAPLTDPFTDGEYIQLLEDYCIEKRIDMSVSITPEDHKVHVMFVADQGVLDELEAYLTKRKAEMETANANNN